MRVFEDVSYTYEILYADEQMIHYHVMFRVDDAFTFLPIPYPKYDSNYGFRFGLKMYDKNLFGTFADLYFVANATQIDSSWNDWKWYGELSVDDIPIGTSTLNLEGTFSITQHDEIWEDMTYTGTVDWVGIQLAETTVGLHADIDEDSLLTTSLRWDSLQWAGSFATVKPEFLFEQNDGEWDVQEMSLYTAIQPFTVNCDPYRLANTTRVFFPGGPIQTTTSLILVDKTVLGLPVSFWISSDNWCAMDDQRIYKNTYTAGLSSGFKLP